MDKVSFEELGSLLVTFHAEQGVQEGTVVKVIKNGTVAPCEEGELFCGVAAVCGNGTVGVQVQGFVQVPVTLPMSLGRVQLAADGQGGVKMLGAAQAETADTDTEQSGAAAAGQTAGAGVAALVVDVDTAGKTAVICL